MRCSASFARLTSPVTEPTAPRTALILAGGSHAHDFVGNGAALAELLAELRISSDIVDTPDDAWAALMSASSDGGYDLLAVPGLRFRMQHPRYDAMRDRWQYHTPPAADAALDAHLAGGGAVLSMHTGCICFDDWDRWSRLLGRRWSWDESRMSWHPERGPVQVTLQTPGNGSQFTLVDECYTDMADLAGQNSVHVWATATDLTYGAGGSTTTSAAAPAGAGRPADQPAVWTRLADEPGSSGPNGRATRVGVCTLGHDRESYEDPHLRPLLTGLIAWLVAN